MTSLLLVRDRDFSWTAREVLRNVENRPHLLLRVDIHGPHFPERGVAPFLRLAAGRKHVTALMTEIDDSQTHMRGYFPTDLALKGRFEFGYASEVLGSLAIRNPDVERLDEARIDSDFHRVTVGSPGAFDKMRR